MKYYIKERHNPQLGVYYKAEGKLSKKRSKEKEGSLYGHNFMFEYDTEEEYEQAIRTLKERGERVQ